MENMQFWGTRMGTTSLEYMACKSTEALRIVLRLGVQSMFKLGDDPKNCQNV